MRRARSALFLVLAPLAFAGCAGVLREPPGTDRLQAHERVTEEGMREAQRAHEEAMREHQRMSEEAMRQHQRDHDAFTRGQPAPPPPSPAPPPPPPPPGG